MKPDIYTVVIVEDEIDVRQHIVDVVTSHAEFELLADVGTEAEGISTVLSLKPDVLLTDLRLPDGSGTNIIRAITEHHLDTEAMVISGFQDEHHVFQSLEAGARGYIYKFDDANNITDAVIAMMKGGSPISPVIARLILNRFGPPTEVSSERPEQLTERQLKILKLVSQGFSSKEIAQKLDISYYTVTTHIKNIYNKLQVNSRTEALHEAVKMGLLGEDAKD